MNRLTGKGHSHEAPIAARKVARDANAWAARLRAEAARRAPAAPPPVVIKGQKA